MKRVRVRCVVVGVSEWIGGGLEEVGRREDDDGREGKDDESVREMGIGETNERKEEEAGLKK